MCRKSCDQAASAFILLHVVRLKQVEELCSSMCHVRRASDAIMTRVQPPLSMEMCDVGRVEDRD